MYTDRAVTRMSSDGATMRLIVDRQTPVKTLPSLAAKRYLLWPMLAPDWPLCSPNLNLIKLGRFIHYWHMFVYIYSHIYEPHEWFFCQLLMTNKKKIP